MKKKIIGQVTKYHGTEYSGMKGYDVRINAVIKNAARPKYNPDKNGQYITDDEELARIGGVTANDRIEVQPWIEKKHRFSWVKAIPKASDLDIFSN